MRVKKEPRFMKLLADLGQWIRDVNAKVDELKTQPDSPERQAQLETLQNAALGLQRSLDSLATTLNRKNGGGDGALPRST
jgi:hypothetical protein